MLHRSAWKPIHSPPKQAAMRMVWTSSSESLGPRGACLESHRAFLPEAPNVTQSSNGASLLPTLASDNNPFFFPWHCTSSIKCLVYIWAKLYTLRGKKQRLGSGSPSSTPFSPWFLPQWVWAWRDHVQGACQLDSNLPVRPWVYHLFSSSLTFLTCMMRLITAPASSYTRS